MDPASLNLRTIGIVNIGLRLVLTDGEESGLSISSAEGEGTTAEFTVPLKKTG